MKSKQNYGISSVIEDFKTNVSSGPPVSNDLFENKYLSTDKENIGINNKNSTGGSNQVLLRADVKQNLDSYSPFSNSTEELVAASTEWAKLDNKNNQEIIDKVNNFDPSTMNVKSFTDYGGQGLISIEQAHGFLKTSKGEELEFIIDKTLADDSLTEDVHRVRVRKVGEDKVYTLNPEDISEEFYQSVIDNKPSDSGVVRYSSVFASRFS